MSEGETESEAEAAPPAKKSKLLPIMLILNTALLGAVLVMVMKRPPGAVAAPAAKAGEHGEAEGKDKPEGGDHAEGDKAKAGGHDVPGPILKLDNFIIQIKTLDADRYVKVAFDVEVGSEPDKTVLTNYMPRIRDAVISYFSDRTMEELRGSEGMETTKTAMLKRLEEIIPGRRIKALYVTDFIVQ